MSTLYSHPDFPEKGPAEINEELMKNVSHNPLLLLTPQKVKRYIESLWKKKSSGQPVTFTDVFGMLIGETLIHNVSRVSSTAPSIHPHNVHCNILNGRKHSTFYKSHSAQFIFSIKYSEHIFPDRHCNSFMFQSCAY